MCDCCQELYGQGTQYLQITIAEGILQDVLKQYEWERGTEKTLHLEKTGRKEKRYDELVTTSLGCSGDCLHMDLLSIKYRLIDLGHDVQDMHDIKTLSAVDKDTELTDKGIYKCTSYCIF